MLEWQGTWGSWLQNEKCGVVAGIRAQVSTESSDFVQGFRREFKHQAFVVG